MADPADKLLAGYDPASGDTPDPYAQEVADFKRRVDQPRPMDFARHIASVIPTDDRESQRREPGEPWWKWWARTGQDSGGGPLLTGMVKSGLTSTANWLEGHPEWSDMTTPTGAAGMVSAPRGALASGSFRRRSAPASAPERGTLMQRLEDLPQVPRRDVLPSDFEVHRTPTPGGGGNEYWIAQPPNARNADSPSQVWATFDPKREQVRIGSSHLPQAQRGEGHGVAMYQRLIDEAHRLGHEVRSDAQVSRDAQRIYGALAERGYEVREHPQVTRNNNGTAEASGPVYTVWPRADRLFADSGKGSKVGSIFNASAPQGQRPGQPWTPERKRQLTPKENIAPPQSWTEERKAYLKRMHENGTSYQDMGFELDVTPRAARMAASKFRDELGLGGRDTGRPAGVQEWPKWTERRAAEAFARLRDAGSITDVAKAMGTTPGELSGFLQRYQKDPRYGDLPSLALPNMLKDVGSSFFADAGRGSKVGTVLSSQSQEDRMLQPYD